MNNKIPFNKPCVVGTELAYVSEAIASGHQSGNGPFSNRCQRILESDIGCARALLTPSCTHALELAALLLDIGPGDEVIMPSFTFVSTANAFALRGATVVFADICPQTLNLDPVAVANAITPRTRAIVPVHYAGVPCDMQPIMALSRKYNIAVVEDAAQAIGSRYQGKPAGSFGQLAAVSFHETKNLTSGGEGGALLINDASLADRAEILREKGTNRAAFFRGHVDKYSWVDVGSSLLPSELQSAYLLAQLEARSMILSDRRRVWDAYKSRLASSVPFLRSPTVPETVEHNGHIFHVRVDSLAKRTLLLDRLNKSGIHAVFHYVPLHSAPAAKQRSRFAGTDVHTTAESECLIRLPLWFGMSDVDIERVCETLERSCSDLGEIAENR